MKKYPPKDSRGVRIKVGDVVRVTALPELNLKKGKDYETVRFAFDHILGTYKTVSGFDKLGHVELMFRVLSGKYKGWHTVWIEPYLLKIRKRRNSPKK